MKKENMLNYLDEQLSKKIPEFDTAIDWDAKNHSIEVMVRLFAENKSHEVIDDIEGTSSEEDVIEFEDGILFYNSQKSQPDPDNYLALIPFEGKKGIRKSVLDSALSYLNEVLEEGQSDLLDFINDPEAETFELVWSQQHFADLVAKAATDEDEFLSYPSY